MTQERWAPIPGYEGLYRVSDSGRVQNMRGKTIATWRRARARKYLAVELWKNNRARNWFVHRLVLLAFVGPPPPGKPHCAHWDGDPLNNTLSNLRWASMMDNHLDAVRHGRVQPRKPRPPVLRIIIPVETHMAVAARRAEGASYRQLQGEFGLSAGVVWRIATGPLV